MKSYAFICYRYSQRQEDKLDPSQFSFYNQSPPIKSIKNNRDNAKLVVPNLCSQYKILIKCRQKALRGITLKAELDNLYVDVSFHVVDVETSHNGFVGLLWLYNMKAIA